MALAAPTPRRLTQNDYELRVAALEQERSSWLPKWRDRSRYIAPRMGRFYLSDRNRGEDRTALIYDNTATRAHRVLAAGMMAGMTSPARPWFRLATTDTQMMEYAPVKLWLDSVTRVMKEIFARSNTYRALHAVYEELGVFGTAANYLTKDFDTVIHNHPLTAGEYSIATDHRGRVTTLARRYEMQLRQMINDFGWDSLSGALKNTWNDGKGANVWVPVVHIIEPREVRGDTRSNKNLPFASCHFEQGSNDGKFLRESGFKRFPAICPRWSTTGGDIYGGSPGEDALGDVKQLQHDQLRKAQAIDFKVKPPLQAPAGLKTSGVRQLPGGVTYADPTAGKIEALYKVDLDLSHLTADIADVRSRINATFYVDLFLMMLNDDRSNITAREIAERHEEKLLMLGPVLERLQDELLKPLIDVTFDEMVAAQLVPPPPPELHEQDLNVEFVSMLAQAQRAVGTQSVDRLLGTIGSIAIMQANSGMPATALDKLDIDQTIDLYADMLGVDASMIVADDKVAIIRDKRVQEQQQMQQAAAAEQAASAAQKLSTTDTSGKNALTDVMGQFSGYSVPGVL